MLGLIALATPLALWIAWTTTMLVGFAILGVTCVALGAENYETMLGIVPFKWQQVWQIPILKKGPFQTSKEKEAKPCRLSQLSLPFFCLLFS